MSSERLLPTGEELNGHYKSLSDSVLRLGISAAIGIDSACVGVFFPPAFGGAVVGIGESIRQGIKMSSEITNFYHKYPRLKKDK